MQKLDPTKKHQHKGVAEMKPLSGGIFSKDHRIWGSILETPQIWQPSHFSVPTKAAPASALERSGRDPHCSSKDVETWAPYSGAPWSSFILSIRRLPESSPHKYFKAPFATARA